MGQDRLAGVGRRRKDKFMDSKQNNLAHKNTPCSGVKSWNGSQMLNFNISPYNNLYLQIKGQKHVFSFAQKRRIHLCWWSAQ